MFVLRPVTVDDLNPLMELAGRTGHGLTTLPRDGKLLRRRILDSTRAFEQMADDRPRGETYLFVLEDLSTGQVVGTSGIVSKVGGFEPFYAYRIETAVHESDVLGVRREVPLLKLVAEHNGPSEIGSLFLSPDHRKDGNGRVLSLVRFLFMAEFPDYFDKVVLAEMRGSIDPEGCSPFWDAIGRHFFAVDFCKADYLSMVNKKFIADLMPSHPIYIPLLPKEAQAVVGQVHPQTAPCPENPGGRRVHVCEDGGHLRRRPDRELPARADPDDPRQPAGDGRGNHRRPDQIRAARDWDDAPAVPRLQGANRNSARRARAAGRRDGISVGRARGRCCPIHPALPAGQARGSGGAASDGNREEGGGGQAGRAGGNRSASEGDPHVSASRGQYVGGAWIDGAGERFSSIDPASGACVWEGRAADQGQIDAAVAAARVAAERWSQAPLPERLAALERFAGQLRADKAAFAEIISREVGKPRWEAAGEVEAMIGKVAISAEANEERCREVVRDEAGVRSARRFKPHGVVAVFGPFNFPGHLPNGHIIPALLAGNTVVFKPSELTPLSGEAMAGLWHDAGLAPGVFNLVQGGRETGKSLAAHPGIDGLFFTGSAAVGLALARSFAEDPGKILALEMGGNNPLVIWQAQDLDAAAYLTIQSAYITSGQRCSCARRLILAEGPEGDALLERLVATIRTIRVGAYTDQPEPFMGPVVSAAAAANLVAAQEQLLRQGGRSLVEMRQAAVARHAFSGADRRDPGGRPPRRRTVRPVAASNQSPGFRRCAARGKPHALRPVRRPLGRQPGAI